MFLHDCDAFKACWGLAAYIINLRRERLNYGHIPQRQLIMTCHNKTKCTFLSSSSYCKRTVEGALLPLTEVLWLKLSSYKISFYFPTLSNISLICLMWKGYIFLMFVWITYCPVETVSYFLLVFVPSKICFLPSFAKQNICFHH